MARRPVGQRAPRKASGDKVKTAAPKEEAIEVEGTIVEPLPNAMSRVELKTGTACSHTFPVRYGCTSSAYFPATASS